MQFDFSFHSCQIVIHQLPAHVVALQGLGFDGLFGTTGVIGFRRGEVPADFRFSCSWARGRRGRAVTAEFVWVVVPCIYI